MEDHQDSGATSSPGQSARRWAQADATVFLDRLAECGNAWIAAAAAGFSPATVYARRRSQADFAARWIAALEAWRASRRQEKHQAPVRSPTWLQPSQGLSKEMQTSFVCSGITSICIVFFTPFGAERTST